VQGPAIRTVATSYCCHAHYQQLQIDAQRNIQYEQRYYVVVPPIYVLFLVVANRWQQPKAVSIVTELLVEKQIVDAIGLRAMLRWRCVNRVSWAATCVIVDS
jgi:hypothetical protein